MSRFARNMDKYKEQYDSQGYVLIEDLLPVEGLVRVRNWLMRFLEGDHDWPSRMFHVWNPELYSDKNGNPLPAGVQLPSSNQQDGEDFRKVANHPSLIETMAALLGGPVKRYTDQCGIKSCEISEEQKGMSFHHQDSYYWHIPPKMGCNVWLPLDEVGAESSALAVMPDSHTSWELEEHEQYFDEPSMHRSDTLSPFKRHRIPLDRVDFAKEVLIPMKPGDALFFSNYTWHRSEKNLTDSHRCFYAIAYQLKESSSQGENA